MLGKKGVKTTLSIYLQLMWVLLVRQPLSFFIMCLCLFLSPTTRKVFQDDFQNFISLRSFRVNEIRYLLTFVSRQRARVRMRAPRLVLTASPLYLRVMKSDIHVACISIAIFLRNIQFQSRGQFHMQARPFRLFLSGWQLRSGPGVLSESFGPHSLHY